MNPFPPILTVQYPCHEMQRRINKALTQSGMRVLETFDLRESLLGSEDCPCPYHGTEECDCQMVVLMVYGDDTAPATLTLHGNDGQTSVSLGNSPTDETEALIRAALNAALKEIFTTLGL